MAFPLLQWLQNQPMTTLAFLFFSPLFLLWLRRLWTVKTINLPPSPPRLPIIGHLHLLGDLPHRSLQALSKKYGPLMLLHMGRVPTLIVSSAEMGKQIMKTHDLNFADRPVTTASRAFLYGGKDMAFAPHGEHWRQMKKLCILDLLSAKRVQSFRFVREEEIANMVNEIKQSSSVGKEVNLSDCIVSVTSNIISRAALSRSLGKSKFSKLAKDAFVLFGHPSVEDMFPSLGWIDVLTGLDGKMKRTSKALLQFFDEVIEEHVMARKNNDTKTDRKDFVDILLDYEENSALGDDFTRENIKGLLMNIFTAGTDTTYTTVERAMAELINHPHLMKRLQEEVRRVVGTKYEVDESEINRMDFLICVIKETLRLHAPTPMLVPRVCTASTIIDGYNIPAKTNVIINGWAIARDPKLLDKPDEFIPERFINNPVDFRGQDFEFIPFGAGRRGCPGISFGIIAVESILANLLYWFDWELPAGKEKIDMTESFGLSVNLKFPLHLFPVSHHF